MFDKRIDFFQIAKEEGKLELLLVYPGKKTIDDPYEKTSTTTEMPSLPIYGIVSPVTAESLKWRYYGKIPMKSIKVTAPLDSESLFKTAVKITYNEENYGTLQDDERNFLITKHRDYLVVILGLQQ